MRETEHGNSNILLAVCLMGIKRVTIGGWSGWIPMNPESDEVYIPTWPTPQPPLPSPPKEK